MAEETDHALGLESQFKAVLSGNRFMTQPSR